MINFKKKETLLTYLAGLITVQKFLDIYFFENQKKPLGDLASFLGDIQICNNWQTMDPAAWEDWLDAINEVIGHAPNKPGAIHSIMEYGGKTLTALQAYNAMRKFLGAYADRISSTELRPFLEEIEVMDNGDIKNPIRWQQWITCLQETLADEYIHFMHLFDRTSK